MAKKQVKKPAKVAAPKPESVVFIKNFSGQLNDWKVKVSKGDTLEVLPFQAKWLKKLGAIE